MKTLRLHGLLLLLLLTADHCPAQAFLAMDLYRATGFKRIKYYPGDDLYFKSSVTGKRYKGKIIGITDSVIYFENKNEISISEIGTVYRNNANVVTQGLGHFCIGFGPGFLCLDTFNNLLAGRKPAVNPTAVIAGAAVAGTGIVFLNMMKRRYTIGKRKTLKVIELSLH